MSRSTLARQRANLHSNHDSSDGKNGICVPVYHVNRASGVCIDPAPTRLEELDHERKHEHVPLDLPSTQHGIRTRVTQDTGSSTCQRCDPLPSKTEKVLLKFIKRIFHS